MTNIVDMTSVTEGDTFSLKDSGIEVNENKFDNLYQFLTIRYSLEVSISGPNWFVPRDD